MKYGTLGKTLTTQEPLNTVDTEEFWDASLPDYDTYQNLVLGLKQKIYTPLPLTDKHASVYNCTPADTDLLTDGKRADNVYSPLYYKSVHGIERNIIFDLTRTSTVSEVRIGVAYCGEAGIYLPRYIRIWLSDNGKSWQRVYTDNHPDKCTEPLQTYIAELDKDYKARFVNIQYGVSCFVFVDEIEVYGTKRVDGNSVPLIPTGTYETEFPDEYYKPNKDLYYGTRHMFLAPYIKTADSPICGITEESWLPYFAYIDEQGKMLDTMFDGVLFFQNTPSETFDKGITPHSVNSYIDYLFADGLNLNSLETACEKIEKTLNLKNFRIPFVFCFPSSPTRGMYEEGDYDGDGKTERFDNLEDMKKVIDHIMSRLESQYKAKKYRHVVFGGYYWEPENVEYHRPFEEEIIRYISDKCHDNGYQFSFIPWHEGSGHQEWKELGFDVCSIQPNYMWYKDFYPEIISETAAYAKKLGCAVEMEINPDAVDDEELYNRYVEYIKQGVLCGSDKSVCFYYQGFVPGAFYRGCMGEGRFGRKIYDLTYEFIKEKTRYKQ